MQTTAAGGVSWEVVEEQAAQSGPKEKKKKKQMTVKVPKWCGKWVVGMDDFKEGVVGAKSKNIAGDLLWRHTSASAWKLHSGTALQMRITSLAKRSLDEVIHNLNTCSCIQVHC